MWIFFFGSGKETIRQRVQRVYDKTFVWLHNLDQRPERFADPNAFRHGREVGKGLALRAALLLLPWQTRLFTPEKDLHGQAWEQGSPALWLSMMCILVAGIASFPPVSRLRTFLRQHDKRMLIGFGLILILLFPTFSLFASVQAIIQLGCLYFLGYLLWQESETEKRLAPWLLASLGIGALFAIQQTLTQTVHGSSWLGMAAQNPLQRGVSVVEVGTVRFLRAYGQFPHPNILGGWMAFAILLTFRRMFAHQKRRWFYVVLCALYAFALYGSFSRSAIIALGAALVVWLIQLRHHADKRRRLLGACCALIGVFALCFAIRPDLILTRTGGQARLEQLSINERTASAKQAFIVIQQHPMGVGLGAYRLGLNEVCATGICLVPTEPPHVIFLLALAELGYLRVMVGIFVVWWALKTYHVLRKGIVGQSVSIPFLFIIAALDHYLWSLWSGQALALLMVVMIVKSSEETVY